MYLASDGISEVLADVKAEEKASNRVKDFLDNELPSIIQEFYTQTDSGEKTQGTNQNN